MIQLIGILIVLNTLVCAGWWTATEKQWGGFSSALIVVALIVGLALIFNERALEITFGKIASLKAAAKQAAADANEIAEIRQRVEAQAATIDLVAKESADAKRLLKELRKENERADEKLKALEGKTSEVFRLPDGRTKFGNIITGQPSILRDRFNEMLTQYDAKEFDKAYVTAKACVELYESSEAAQKDVAMVSGGTSSEAVSVIYEIAAAMAQRAGEHERALLWAKRAFKETPSPEREALLITTYLNAHQLDEAGKLIKQLIGKDDPDSKKAREILLQIGVIKPKNN